MFVLNALFPARCEICKKLFIYKKQNIFCPECVSKIKKENVYHCRSCGSKFQNCQRCLKKRVFDDLKVFKNNDRVITEVIYWLKIRKYKNIAPLIAQIIKEDITDFVKKNSIDLITYVPLDKKTHRERGFNHLYQILLEIFPKFLIKDIVIKTKKTRLQMQLSAEERHENLKDVFRLKEINIKDKNILIFDDILTTGSTMINMQKTVKKGKPSKIFGYVIAR